MFNYFISHKNKEISCFPASIIDEINEGIQTNTNTIKMESSSSGSYYCNTYPIASAPGIVSVTDRTPPSSMVVSSGYSKLNWFSENLEIWGENAQNVCGTSCNLCATLYNQVGNHVSHRASMSNTCAPYFLPTNLQNSKQKLNK